MTSVLPAWCWYVSAVWMGYHATMWTMVGVLFIVRKLHERREERAGLTTSRPSMPAATETTSAQAELEELRSFVAAQ